MKLIRADRRSPVRTWKYGDSNVSASATADPPDRAVAVLGHEKRAVVRDRDADRAAPHLRGRDHEAGHEILVFAGRLAALVEKQPDDLVSHASLAIPGAVHRDERAALVPGRKMVAHVEGH